MGPKSDGPVEACALAVQVMSLRRPQQTHYWRSFVETACAATTKVHPMVWRSARAQPCVRWMANQVLKNHSMLARRGHLTATQVLETLYGHNQNARGADPRGLATTCYFRHEIRTTDAIC